LPSCSFCEGKVLPADMEKSGRKHPVCAHCRQVLDEYMETRAVDYMQTELEDKLPEMLEQTLADWEGRAFVVKFDDKWNKQLSGKVQEVISESLADLVKAEVAEALKSGLSALVSGSRPLARGKKHSDSKTSQEAV